MGKTNKFAHSGCITPPSIHRRWRIHSALAFSLRPWLKVTKFTSPHSYFSIMFRSDLSDQGNYLGSWVITVRDKAPRDPSASD